MTYDRFRHQIKTGDLLAWSTHRDRGLRRIINNLIRIFTMSEYCHVGIAWVVGDRIFIVEAVRPAVRIFPLSNEVPFFHIAMNLDVQDKWLNYLLSRVGEPYSVWQAIRTYFGKPKADKQWQCAEFTANFFKQCGISLRNAWTPSTLVNAVLSLDSQKQLTFISR